jgi:hypothetical protein
MHPSLNPSQRIAWCARFRAAVAPAVVVTGLLAAASGPIIAADKFRQLTAAQIKTMVIGKAITDDTHWSDHFYPDGTLKSLELGEPLRGTWRLEGSSLCIARRDKRGKKETECNEIWKSNERIEYRRFGTTAAEGVLRDQW